MSVDCSTDPTGGAVLIVRCFPALHGLFVRRLLLARAGWVPGPRARRSLPTPVGGPQTPDPRRLRSR
jgi:hypothetical protein